MKIISRFFLAAVAFPVLFTACTEEHPSQHSRETDSWSDSPSTVPHTMRVKVTEELSEILLASPDDNPVIGKNGVTGIKPTFHIGGKFEKVQRESGLHLWFDFELSPDTKSGDSVLSIDGVTEAERIYLASPTDAPFNDPLYGRQWHYHNTGSSSQLREGVDIGLQEAWETYGIYGNNSVTVGIVDLGVDCNHEDLRYNMWVNEAEYNGTKGVDDDGNGYVDDIYGYNFVDGCGEIEPDDHGTHVAGTVAAVNNNGIGVAGIAGGNYPQQGVRIMSIQYMGKNHSGSDIVEQYQYAAENGAVILQNSWSYIDTRILPSYAKTAIDYFIDHAGMDENGNQIGKMKGGLVVFAAGNDSRDYCYPAMYERVLAVAAVGPKGNATNYTNYGPWVDVCAPGGDSNGAVYSTLCNNTYGGMTGTSMACPHVSGMAALLLSEFGGPGYTCDMLRDVIEYTTDRSIYDYNKGREGMLGTGLVNLVNAIASMSKQAPETPEIISAYGLANSIVVKASIPEDPDDKHAAFFKVFLTSPSGERTFQINSAEEFRIPELEFNTEYTIQISALDRAGNESGRSRKVTVSTLGNNPPTMKADSDIEHKLTKWQSTEWMVSFSDEDLHEFGYSYEADEASAVFFTRIDANTLRVHVTGPASEFGQHDIRIYATDEYGASSCLILKYTVTPNHAPVLVMPIPNICLGDDHTLSVDVTEYFTDEDNDNPRVSAEYTGNSLSHKANGTVLSFTTETCGLYPVNISVTDNAGETVTTTFSILLRDEGMPCDIFPNPVSDFLNLRTSTDGTTVHVKVVSPSGKVIVDTDAASGPFSPARIDFSKFAPGRYGVEATVSGAGSAGTVRKIVVKK